MILGEVTSRSTCITGGTLDAKCPQLLGWNGTLDDGIDDRLWRTLVANRSQDGKSAPTWYRRACALALTQLGDLGTLDTVALVGDPSQPGILVEYLKRVETATQDRRIFRCTGVRSPAGPSKQAEEAIIGVGRRDLSADGFHVVCILYGCSVPVMLDCDGFDIRLIGPCYVHGYMEGEMFAAISEGEIRKRTTMFSIH
jgi:hypothetical protein